MGGVVRSVGNLYDLNVNRIRIVHPDGSYFTYDQDGLDRPTVVRENGGAPIATFAYDTAGRRSSSGWAAITTFAYDAVGRLQTLSHNLAGDSRDHVLGFAYNPASQLHSRSASNDAYAWRPSENVARAYAVNGLNQYLSAGPATFTHDANGNLASTANAPWSTAYVYDVENRLVSASGSHNAELVYDPLGRLWQVSSGASVRRLVYDGDALVAEYDSAGNMAHRYIHGNDAGDDPLVWYDNFAGGWRRALLTDHQGSVIQVADMYGQPVATNSYDPWGIPAAANAGRFGYTGQAWVPELGLWYYKARFYSPTTGRFLQVDPVGYEDQINLYAYLGNDPVNLTDPSGMQTASVGECPPGKEVSAACRSGGKDDRATTPQTATKPAPSARTVAQTQSAIALAARCPICALGAATTTVLSGAAVTLFGSRVETSIVNRPSLFLPAPPQGTQQAWAGTITSGRTNTDQIFYRVWGGQAAEIGRWLSPTPMASSSQARSLLALPPANAASMQSIVRVPSGTLMQYGHAARAFGQPGGGMQVLLLQNIPPSNFGPATPLE